MRINKTAALIILFTLMAMTARADTVDLSIIAKIESSNNPFAFNPKTLATGLYQVTPICLVDFNDHHNFHYPREWLFVKEVNEEVAKWYLTERIPQMLRHYKKPANIDNILWVYNAGIGKVVKGIKPKETQQYLEKYRRLAKTK